MLSGVKPREDAVGIGGQLEVAFDDERGVCEVYEVLFRDAVVLDGVVDDAAKKCNVRSGANLGRKGLRPRKCA